MCTYLCARKGSTVLHYLIDSQTERGCFPSSLRALSRRIDTGGGGEWPLSMRTCRRPAPPLPDAPPPSRRPAGSRPRGSRPKFPPKSWNVCISLKISFRLIRTQHSLMLLADSKPPHFAMEINKSRKPMPIVVKEAFSIQQTPSENKDDFDVSL